MKMSQRLLRSASTPKADAATSHAAKKQKTVPPNGFRVPYRMGPSKIAGHGVFSLKPVKRGTLIWEYVVGESVAEHDYASLRARLKGMPKEARNELLEHVYCWDGSVIEILDDAKVWNHSATPNTGSPPDGTSLGADDDAHSYALRDIKAGEELTDDYALHAELPWFEKLCSEHRVASCTSLGKEFR
jgi:hypothetical protein